MITPVKDDETTPQYFERLQFPDRITFLFNFKSKLYIIQ